MKIELVRYHGWEDCVQLSHDDIRLVVTTAIGPRIIFCGFLDGSNLFYENPQHAGTRFGNECKTYGGHRLWCAPEVETFTYAPDNFSVSFQEQNGLARFTSPMEPSGVQKTICIQPIDSRNGFYIEHWVENLGSETLSLAPWAVTMMRAGGTAIIPLNLEPSHLLLPVRHLSLWGYTQMNDPRWSWGARYIFLRQGSGAAATPQKFGVQNPYGWAAYAVEDQLFLKRFAWLPGAQYPDFNVNFEAYTNQKMLELESLAPLVDLKPGDKVMHSEEWFLYRNVQTPQSEADVDKNILPLIEW